MTADSLPHGPRPARHRKAPPPSSGRGRRRARREPPAATRQPGTAARIAGLLAYAVSRLVVCAGLCGLAALAFKKIFQIRLFEAWLASHVVQVGAHVPTGYWHSIAAVWFAPSPADQVGLGITPECTVGLLIIPFLLITAAAVWLRTPLHWPLIALVISLVLLVVINQLRLLTVVWFILAMGNHSGFYWGHTLVGSLITIAGIALSLAVYAKILLKRGSPARSR